MVVHQIIGDWIVHKYLNCGTSSWTLFMVGGGGRGWALDVVEGTFDGIVLVVVGVVESFGSLPMTFDVDASGKGFFLFFCFFLLRGGRTGGATVTGESFKPFRCIIKDG